MHVERMFNECFKSVSGVFFRVILGYFEGVLGEDV